MSAVGGGPADHGPRAINSPRTVLTIVAFVLGVFVGRSIAYQVSRGGFDAGIGAGLWLYGTIFLILLALGATAIAARIGRKPVGAALRPVLIGAGVLLVGGIAGNLTAAFTGGTYRSPVETGAPGTMTLRLDGQGSAFVPVASSVATCRSLPDSAAVGEITGLALGTLGGRQLRGTVSLPFANAVSARVDLWIDGADLPDGAAQPFWSGPISVSLPSDESTSGVATFDALVLGHDPKLPAYTEAFPETLVGRLEWSCGVFPGS